MSLHISTLHRNKRCLLAYQSHRTSKLRDLRFETSIIPPHLKKQLSKQEIEYFKEYDTLLESYQRSLGLSLTSFVGGTLGGEGAPMSNMIEIRVTKKGGAGEIITDDGGTVDLKEGTTHFLKRGDVERMIRMGEVEQVRGGV
ncbi:hypothetical protein TrRE_jg3244 [Triparma retinervis]|uniref:DNA replication complex GINS protein PSF1 n=1 Tax=Triparma retinervis TaxID=2557542 RepID=A0A9W7CHC6_9STRA|nr:hypothetical protein TrRE_jg3244 [Triparma retinervis]